MAHRGKPFLQDFAKKKKTLYGFTVEWMNADDIISFERLIGRIVEILEWLNNLLFMLYLIYQKVPQHSFRTG